MKDIFFSVVIPLYNKQGTIRRAINSVLAQTHPFFEILVVNDGSTDSGEDEVKAIKDKRLKYIFQPNRGVSIARNVGVKNATADWIAFLDADDEYLPDFLEYNAKVISQFDDEGVSFLGSNYCRSVSNYPKQHDFDVSGRRQNYFELFTNLKAPSNSSSTIVSKNHFLKVNGFPENIKIFEDWDLWFKLALIGDYWYNSKPLSVIHLANNYSSRKINLDDVCDSASYLSSDIRKEIEDKIWHTISQKDEALFCLNEYLFDIANIMIINGKFRNAFRLMKDLQITHLKRIGFKRYWVVIKGLLVPYEFRRGLKRFLSVKHSKGSIGL